MRKAVYGLIGLVWLCGCGGSGPEPELEAPKQVASVAESVYAPPAPVTGSSLAESGPAGLPQAEELTAGNAAQSVSAAIVPAFIKIPAIKVDASVVEVGLLDNGEMGVPEDDAKVGWFEPGYKPGTAGSAVMAGHVDNKTGPAVFFYLKKLKPGDRIEVLDTDGRQLLFEVKEVVAYVTDEAPIQEIFGPSDIPRLNLITCTGRYNPRTTEHEKRLVVYSELVQA